MFFKPSPPSSLHIRINNIQERENQAETPEKMGIEEMTYTDIDRHIYG